MKKKILLAACAVVFGASANQKALKWQKALDSTVPCVYTNNTGDTLLYRWAEPKNFDSSKKYPLVVLLHGAGERGTNNRSQLVHGATELFNYAEKNNIDFYFIAGQVKPNNFWVQFPWDTNSHRMDAVPSQHMALLLELVDKVKDNKNVDLSRIYITGISMGGYGTWDAVQRRPELWAAAVPICGGGDSLLAWKIREVPIWAFHGGSDSVVPAFRSRDMVSSLWNVNGNIRYTEYPGVGHGSWFPAYGSEETWQWLFKQRRKAVQSKVCKPCMAYVKWVPGDGMSAEVCYSGCKTGVEYLERVRQAGEKIREMRPGAKVIGVAPDEKFIKEFLATGEIEEVDAWRLDGMKGNAPEKILAAGYGRAFIMNKKGEIVWSKMGCGNIHRVQKCGNWIYYSNGDLWKVPMNPVGMKAQIVYRAKVRKGGGVYGFEVCGNGNIVMAINSSSEIVEIDAKGKEVVRFAVKAEKGGDHGKLRMVHKTKNGTYLVCAAGDATVREYDAKGTLVWEQQVPVFAFDSARLPNGNTIVSHVTGLTEYSPDHKVVREFKPESVPELGIANLTAIEALPNGNIVVGTWQNGKTDCSRTTAFELTPDNKVVWSCAVSDANMMSATRID
jgi:dienelactone hydrolase